MGVLSALARRLARPNGARAAEFERMFGRDYYPPERLFRGMTQPMETGGWRAPRSKYDGTWLSDNPDLASSYARSPHASAWADGGTVYPVRARGKFMDDRNFVELRRHARDLEHLRSMLQANGYIGAHVPHARSWMVLDPEHIVSAL